LSDSPQLFFLSFIRKWALHNHHLLNLQREPIMHLLLCLLHLLHLLHLLLWVVVAESVLIADVIVGGLHLDQGTLQLLLRKWPAVDAVAHPDAATLVVIK
jgi:hypothetical protein